MNSFAFLLVVCAVISATPIESDAGLSGLVEEDIRAIGEHVQEDIQTMVDHMHEGKAIPDTFQTIGQQIAEGVQTLAEHLQGSIEVVGAQVQESVQQINQGGNSTTAATVQTPQAADEGTSPGAI